MNVKQYILQKQARVREQLPFRSICRRCLQPQSWCYCEKIQTMDFGITFAILLHPLERRRRIASGRMAHLLLQNSYLIVGHEYSNDPVVNQLLEDPNHFPVILCMGEDSKNISQMSEADKKNICPREKRLLVFVVDGTWGTASKTIRLSHNLKNLPKISFIPSSPSRFRVRQQPQENCYSTIEAIHQTIELIGTSQGFDIHTRKHDHLLEVFDFFVLQQLKYVQHLKTSVGLQYRKINR